MAIRSLMLVFSVVCLSLFVFACEVEDEAIEAACEKILEKCPQKYEDELACSDDIANENECKFGCVEAASDCTTIEQCLSDSDLNGTLLGPYCSEKEDGDIESTPITGEGGVCYWQYDTGSQYGFGCQADVADEDACQNHVTDQTNGGDWLVQWEFMPECAEIGCTGACGPDWWSLY